MPAAPAFPPAPDRVTPRRALLSLSDKTGLEEVGRQLAALGVELVSTGGTRAALLASGLAVRDVAELTGFPEMMDGRVKTLHPAVHGGLLGVRNAPEHAAAMAEHGIIGIDVIYVSLYPFEATVAAGGDFATAVENIDIGGPAMIRSGAKNHGHVAVAIDAASMDEVLQALEAVGATTLAQRKLWATRAFGHTAAYDSAIAGWFGTELQDAFPPRLSMAGQRLQRMRYGENPHQQAAFYAGGGAARPGVAAARQLQGKELSYNNVADTDAAFELVAEFDPAEQACVAIIKHGNPCGVGLADTPLEAYRRALACDPVSAFGGIVALNRPLDGETARAAAEIFTEVVIAPEADEEAVAVFAAKKNVRLLVTGGLPDPAQPDSVFRSVAGGFLVQTRDTARLTPADLKVVTRRAPTEAEVRDLLFAFVVAKHVRSNAIVYAREGRTLGVGSGQTNRKDSARIAALRARDFGLDLQGCACASEAFFPFADGLVEAVEAGATAVIQPGGSIRDAEVIAAADVRDVAMVFTGVRVFRH